MDENKGLLSSQLSKFKSLTISISDELFLPFYILNCFCIFCMSVGSVEIIFLNAQVIFERQQYSSISSQ